MVTVRAEIIWATSLPATTAIKEQMACPTIAPAETEKGSSLAARMMVVICDLSPHSATNVIVNVSKKTKEQKRISLRLTRLPRERGRNVVVIPDDDDDDLSCRNE